MTDFGFVHTESAAIAHDRFVYADPVADPPPETNELLAWLARLRLLNGIPFAYLVNDAELLPEESIRFFYLDRNWTDAAIDGALSVATVTTRDRTQLRATYDQLLVDVDRAERQQFQSQTGAEMTDGPAEVATGFLLRSRAVSGWPGIHVQAFRGPGDIDEIGIMRIERLAPAVLLVLFDGLPGYVTVTEPRQGIQFGVEVGDTSPSRRQMIVRNDDGTERDRVGVPFCGGSPGVIHWGDLSDRVARALGLLDDNDVPEEVSSARMALQALRFPYQQGFGDRGAGPPDGDTFRPNPLLLDSVVQSNTVSWIAD